MVMLATVIMKMNLWPKTRLHSRWWLIWNIGHNASCFLLPSEGAFSASFILLENSSRVSSISSKPSGGGLRLRELRIGGMVGVYMCAKRTDVLQTRSRKLQSFDKWREWWYMLWNDEKMTPGKGRNPLVDDGCWYSIGMKFCRAFLLSTAQLFLALIHPAPRAFFQWRRREERRERGRLNWHKASRRHHPELPLSES